MTDNAKRTKPEILAPAGEWDALVAAVQSGADAVYLGGKAFSARQNAGNFGPEELARAVTYAHVRGVRVYVTANTLIKENELDGALSYLAELYELGVDAVILQDLGLFRLARQVFPSWRLHASTQMTVHHAEAARYLREQGMDRVVLARELSLPEIAACAATGVEVEVFVHGALCVCYSGQCLMSSMIGGRSGNRGRCAQPCRLEYSLVDREGRPIAAAGEAGPHLLSPRDLAALDLLPQLVAAGVSALKIEGRMKRPEYVATVARIYREALDELQAGDGQPLREERRRNLAQAFNRGFTSGYLLGNPGRELMSFQKASNRGVYLGRVAFYDRSRRLATLRLENPLAVGDGLEFWVSQGGRVGVTVSRFWSADRRDGAARPLTEAEAGLKVVIPVEGALQPGDRVFKTSDADLLAQAASSYRSSRELLRLPLKAHLNVGQGKLPRLTLTDPEGRTVTAEGTVAAVPAEKRALERDAVESQLSRLGNTPFTLDQLDLDLEPGTMLPWSELNTLRRTALTELEERRRTEVLPPAEEVEAARTRLHRLERERRGGADRSGQERTGLPYLAVAVSGLDELPDVLKAGPDRVILGGERFRPAEAPFWPEERVAEAARRCREAGVEFVLGFPRITRTEELSQALTLAGSCLRRPEAERPHALLAGNLALFSRLAELLAESGAGVALHADHPLSVFNTATLSFLAERGAAQITLSPELTLEELREVVPQSQVVTEVLAHGPLELMVTEYCAPGALLGGRTSETPCAKVCGGGGFGLRDRLGLVFPLRVDASCRMHLANPKELCLVEHLPALAGVAGVIRLDCRLREAPYAAQVTRAYRSALTLLAGTSSRDGEAEALQALRRELESLAPCGITKGHLYRGVE